MSYALFMSQDRAPLDPVSENQAFSLLRRGQAAILRHHPLTLIARQLMPAAAHEYRLKINPGSKKSGLAILRDDGKVVWAMELQHRGNAISAALTSRRSLRRGRRGRKTRYRAPRFLNRTKPKGWLPPSLCSRVENIMTWVNRIIAACPITDISMALVKFDLQEMQNPGIKGVEYQQGTLAGYNIREYLYEKFRRTCVYCGLKEFKPDGQKVVVRWEVDHVQPRSQAGTNRISNLVLCCHKCNQKKGKRSLEEFVKDPVKLKQIQAQLKMPLRDAAAVNSTRRALFERLKATGLPIECGTGGRTAFNRIGQGLPKSHWIDAACVGESTPTLNIGGVVPLQVKATGHGNRKMQGNDAYGFPNKTPRQRTKRRHGFQTGDIAIARVPKGKHAGTFGGRVGAVRATKVIEIRKRAIHPKYCTLIQRADGYEYLEG